MEVGLTDDGASGEIQQPEYALYQWEYYPEGNVNQFLLSAAIDANGNRTDYEYNGNHRLTKIIQPPDEAGGERAETLYFYDAAGRLGSVADPMGRVTQYDALGRRVAKVVNHSAGGTTTQSVFVCVTRRIQHSQYAGQVVAEYESVAAAPLTLARKFAFGVYIDEPLVMIDCTLAGSAPPSSDEFFHYHSNRLYCVTALTDGSASVVERCAYPSYGEPTVLAPDTAVVRSSSILGNVFTFSGRTFDAETHGLAFRGRMYVPAHGRFAGRDPLVYVHPENLYQFVRSAPFTYLDPTGLAWTTKEIRSVTAVGIECYCGKKQWVSYSITVGAGASAPKTAAQSAPGKAKEVFHMLRGLPSAVLGMLNVNVGVTASCALVCDLQGEGPGVQEQRCVVVVRWQQQRVWVPPWTIRIPVTGIYGDFVGWTTITIRPGHFKTEYRKPAFLMTHKIVSDTTKCCVD